jgi:hypothetical protein
MVCFRTRRLAAGLFVFSVLLAACGKKDEGKGAGGAGGASSVDNKDLDTIPVESDVVLSVDLAQAQQSALFREQVQPMMTRSGDLQKVTELLKTKCNLDPMTAATRLTAGIKLLDGRNAEVVAVLHGIEKSKAMPCLDQLKAELAAEKVEVTTDGDVVMLKGGGADLAFTFTGDKTAVVVLGPKANKAGVLEAAAGKSPLRTSKAFTEMYSRIQTSHTAWALVRGDADLVRKNLDRLSVRADAIYGSAKVTDGLELHGQIRVQTEEQATNLRDLIRNQSKLFETMAEKLEIEADKTDVRTTVVFTQAQVKSLVGLVRTLTGRRPRRADPPAEPPAESP